MREKLTKHFRVVSAASPDEFERRMNEAFEDLAEKKNFRYEFNMNAGHCCYIQWDEIEKIAVTARDQCELDGVRLYCGECPKCERPRDGRKKWCECPLAPGGVVTVTESACEWFCREYLAGRVRRRGEE